MTAAIPTSYNEKDKIWSGAPRSRLYDLNTSVGKVIHYTMKNWPTNVCQINDDDGITLTNSQALTWAIRIAQQLQKRELTHEHVIGITGRNTTYMMPLAVGCLFNATPFHTVNPVWDPDTIKFVYEITKPSVIFVDAAEYEKVREATLEWSPEIFTLDAPLDGVPHIETLLLEASTATEMFYQPQALQQGGDQTMAILCSSGTTGLPKAVCISNAMLTLDNMPVNNETVVYVASSLDWVSGLIAFIFCTVFGSTRVVTAKPFAPENFVRLAHTYKISFTIMPPRHLSVLNNCPAYTPEAMASMRQLTYGGELANGATLQRAQEICKNALLNSGYGMTEIPSITLNLGISNYASAGRVQPGNRIRIVDDDGKNLGYKQVGEICVHAGRKWAGYYGNPEETLKMQDSEGWFHTGDLGYFDEQNFLYIVDRKRETLKYEGHHYWPTEIESVIAELPQIESVCVVGIKEERYGDLAAALVVKAAGCDISAQQIEQHVERRLKGIEKKLHGGVRFTDKLPTNVNGKIMRKAAKEMFMALK